MKYLPVLLLLLLLIIGCNTPTQMQYNAEVDRLCAKDGGVKIYEKIYLPSDQFNKYNHFKYYDPRQGESAYGPKYRAQTEETYIHGDSNIDSQTQPRLIRFHERLFRRADEKLLGEGVSYMRVGGDPIWARWSGPPTSYLCPKESMSAHWVTDGVFINATNGSKK